MAFEQTSEMDIGTQVAAADLTANQYQPVFFDTSGKVALCATLGMVVDGILQNKPSPTGTNERAAQVRPCSGLISRVKVGAAVTAGDLLTTDATGRAIHAVTTGHHIFGKALQTATAAGQIITVLLNQYGIV